MKRKDLTGMRFGRLIVTGEWKYFYTKSEKRFKWKCVCDCGNTCYVVSSALLSGATKSCGCLAAERKPMLTRTHGMSKTKFYEAWQGMFKRTRDKNNKHYNRYGGRGITVCEKWNKFENFKSDMYESFKSHMDKYGSTNTTLDRIDNDGNYCPENCKWSTQSEQAMNRSTSKKYLVFGEKLCIKQISDKYNIPRWCISKRLKSGWIDEDLIKSQERKGNMILNQENYFSKEAELEYWGSSSFKAWDMNNEGFEIFSNQIEGGCEKREVAVRNGDYVKPYKEAFLVGSYVHANFEGVEAFRKLCDEEYEKIYTRSGKPRAAFERADKMIHALESDPLVMEVLQGDKERYFTGEIGGQNFKIKVDVLNTDCERPYFVDIKTTDKIGKRVFKNGQMVSFFDAYDYKLQFAIYSEILYQNFGFYFDMYTVVVDKTPEPDHEILYIGRQDDENSFVWDKLSYIEYKIGHMQDVKTGKVEPVGCGKCAYCKSIKKVKRPLTLAEFEEKIGL